jgi:hypothetical protein
MLTLDRQQAAAILFFTYSIISHYETVSRIVVYVKKRATAG